MIYVYGSMERTVTVQSSLLRSLRLADAAPLPVGNFADAILHRSEAQCSETCIFAPLV